MTDPGSDDSARDDCVLNCVACGASHRAGDRFCADCGASLATPSPPTTVPPLPVTTEDAALGGADSPFPAPDMTLPEPARQENQGQDTAVWLLGARPRIVIAGGVVLLLLAAALLAIGQRDDTGTIVMLSICTAPLGLLTLVIGIARYVAGGARRG